MSRFRLTTCDALAMLTEMEDESVDLIVTDPAYESLEKHRAKGTTTRLKKSDASSNEWFDIFPNERFPRFFRECYRVLKEDAHLYVMSDQETAFFTKPLAEAAGFKWWKHLVWAKTKGHDDGSGDVEELGDGEVSIGMGYHYRAAHEVIGFYEKGKRRLNSLSVPDVLPIPRVRGGYPTEKPVGLCRVLIEQSSAPGEVVFDPFYGSASCGEAALITGRDFIGCDVAPGIWIAGESRLGKHGTRVNEFGSELRFPRTRKGLFE